MLGYDQIYPYHRASFYSLTSYAFSFLTNNGTRHQSCIRCLSQKHIMLIHDFVCIKMYENVSITINTSPWHNNNNNW